MKKKIKIISIYTILFICISLVVFSPFLLNGRSFIWEVDGFQQHFIVFSDFSRILKEILKDPFHIQQFSWNIGLGSDILGQYSYYIVGDIFSYLSAFCPENMLAYLYTFLIVFRFYCSGLAFMAFSFYKKHTNFQTLIGALIYAFCAFNLVGCIKHPYFANALIFFPLFLLATERFVRDNKKGMFIIISALCMISNFYFCYMITLAGFGYAFIIYIFDYRHEKITWLFKKIGVAIGCYGLAFLMSAVIMIPGIIAFLTSSRLGVESISIYPLNYYRSILTGLISTDQSFWSILGVSSIIVATLPILLKRRKEEPKLFVIFCILTIMLVIPIFGSVMNGLSYPNNRWSFIYSFLLAYIISHFLNSKLEFTSKELICSTLFSIIYFIIILVIEKFYVIDYIISFLVIFIFLGYLWYIHYKKQVKSYINMILILSLIIFNVTGVGFQLYSSQFSRYANNFLKYSEISKKYDTVNGSMKNYKDAIQYIKANDSTFYRITREPNWTQNLSVRLDYKSMSSYLSLVSGYASTLSYDIGNSQYTTSNTTKEFDDRTKVTTLLSTKYSIVPKNKSAYVPYGYELLKTIGDTSIYINQHALLPVTFYNDVISLDEFEKLDPLEKEDSLIKQAAIKNADGYPKANISSPSKEEYTIISSDNITLNSNRFVVKKKDSKLRIRISDVTGKEIYIKVSNLNFKPENKKQSFDSSISLVSNKTSKTFKIEDKKTSPYYISWNDIFWNIGNSSEDNQMIELVFKKPGIYSFDNFECLTTDMKEYEANIANLKMSSPSDLTFGDNSMKMSINATKDGIIQLATNYSKGWKAYVDGQSVDTFVVNKAFVGIKINKGFHHIEFKYERSFQNLSLVMTGFGVIGFIILILVEKKIKI